MGRRIITVQDLIDQLLSVANPKSRIEIEVNEQLITPDMFDFTIIDYSDCNEDDGEAEERVVLQCFR